MFLLVLAHPGCPGQASARELVVVVVVVAVVKISISFSNFFDFELFT